MIVDLQKRLNLSNEEIDQIKEYKAAIVLDKWVIVVVVIVAMFGVAGYFIFPYFITIFITWSLILLFIGIGLYRYDKKRRVFSLSVKNIIIKGLFMENFSNVSYEPEKGLTKDFIKATGLYPMGNRFSSEDLLSATYKNVNFTQSDVSIEDESSDGETTTTTTIFYGRWLVCDFIKDFNGYHHIRSNAFFKNRKPYKLFGDNLKNFKFEDDEFNKKFTTYTSDQKEAYYLINPGYMERLKKFVEYADKEVVFGFLDNKLHVAIYNNKDAFELKGNKIDEDFVDRIEVDIELIKLIIDELDLQLDIFK